MSAVVTRKRDVDDSLLRAAARGWLSPEIHGTSLIDCIEKGIEESRRVTARLEAALVRVQIESNGRTQT